jgi:hypothetical protein
MKRLHCEPSALILDRVYQSNQIRPITIDGHVGILTAGGGGWGDVAIHATFGDIEIVARERESEDYEQTHEDGCPDRLELYRWERDGQYYVSLSDAIAGRNPQSRAL